MLNSSTHTCGRVCVCMRSVRTAQLNCTEPALARICATNTIAQGRESERRRHGNEPRKRAALAALANAKLFPAPRSRLLVIYFIWILLLREHVRSRDRKSIFIVPRVNAVSALSAAFARTRWEMRNSGRVAQAANSSCHQPDGRNQSVFASAMTPGLIGGARGVFGT